MTRLQRKMKRDAKNAIMKATEWLPITPEYIQMEMDGYIFSLQHEKSIVLVPAFMVNTVHKNIVKQILKLFKDYSSLQKAAWFTSVNGYLNGDTPCTVFEKEPLMVLLAARKYIEPVLHG